MPLPDVSTTRSDAAADDQDAGLHIVLVDDNEHDRAAFRRAFRKNAAHVSITEYVLAEVALTALRQTTEGIDVVVTNYRLPGMSGLALCEELFAHHAPFPLVILTGAGSEHLAVDALKAGVNDYIIQDSGQGYLELLLEVRRRFSIKSYIEEILLSLRPKLKRTHHQITVNCPDSLEIERDPGAFSQISQILSNLIMNSLTHGVEGIEQGAIDIDLAQKSDQILFTYHDNGHGIPAENMAQPFSFVFLNPSR